jgi:transcription initiation factor TFIIB
VESDDSKAIIFDPETNETVCSSCGIVLRDNVQKAGAEPECQLLWRFMIWVCQLLFLIQIRTQTVFRCSDQISKVKKMTHLNRISSSNRSHDRNLKNAFAILNSIKDKPSINDTLMEKSAYIYRKALDKRIIKGRSICALIVASIYAACREANVPRTLDEIAQTANTDAIFAAKCYRLLVRN